MKMEKDCIDLSCEEALVIFELLPLLGVGSTGAVYQWGDKAVKIFSEPDPIDYCGKKGRAKFNYFMAMDVLDYSFPQQAILVRGSLRGYVKPVILGKDLDEEPYHKSFSLLKRLIAQSEASARLLSESKIVQEDLGLCNVVYNDHFHFIDVDAFHHYPSFSIQECIDMNLFAFYELWEDLLAKSLGLSLFNDHDKYFLAPCNSKLHKGSITSLEYVDLIQNRLSEIAGRKVKTLAEGAKVLSKR